MNASQGKRSSVSQKVSALLQSAMEYHQSGDLARAETLYEQILKLSPYDLDALHLLGVAAFQKGNPARAEELISKAIKNGLRSEAAYANQGNALHALGRYQSALECFEKALRLNPDSADAYSNRGNTLQALGNLQAAAESYDKAILLNPNLPEAYNNRGTVLRLLKQYQAAAESCSKATLLRPDFVEAYINLGCALIDLRQYPVALESFRKALLLNPQCTPAYSNLSTLLRKLKQYEAAVESCTQAILLAPDYAEAYSNRGAALMDLQQYQAALENFDKALLLNPRFAEALRNRGGALRKLKYYEAAVESCTKAIALAPDYAKAYSDRGAILMDLHQHQEALANFDKAVLLDPDLAEAYCLRGSAQISLHQYSVALSDLEKAIAIQPDYAQAYCNHGAALTALHQYNNALESINRAVLIDPEMPEAYCNRGAILMHLNQYQAAVESYDKAILVDPNYAKAYSARGLALMFLNRYQAALESYDKAIDLKTDESYVPGLRLHVKGLLCAWDGYEEDTEKLATGVNCGEKVSVPFEMLVISDSPEIQRKAAETFAQDNYPISANLSLIPKRVRRDRIRVGYFSSDYHNHATSYLIAELLELQDRNNFELFGFSFGRDSSDEMRQRIVAAMDKFVDIRQLSDYRVAQLCREMEIDIAVDLKGFTHGCRTGIFAERAAPVQVSYLGYPGTMGTPYIDYLIADQTIIPEESRSCYSEKIVYLPDCYQVNDSRRQISAGPCSRADEGLPEKGFVFCCFNNAYKISPDRFGIWMRLLQSIEGSVLWLLQDDPATTENLRKEAMLRGVSPERLVFAARKPLSEHLARHRLADLFLDTSPCGAHTTASDALWAGLPVLTCAGRTFASRVAASLLHAIHLPDLVTTSDQEYENLATEIGRNPERLREIKERLKCNRLTTPLFDIKAYTRNLEAAYRAIYERYQMEMAPEDIYVAETVE